MNKQPLPIGHFLQNRYKIIKLLGSGGFGITYLCQDTNTRRIYAIKEYFPTGASRSDHRVVFSEQEMPIKSFIDEVRAFLHLHGCPNIAHLYDFFRENETFYMVSDYIEGDTLYDIIRRKSKIDPQQGLEYMEDIAKALGCIHNQQLLHRDVTPNNIIIQPSGQAVLIDFGSARFFENRTQSMTSMLTPDYSPPEQFLKEGHYSPALDIYSLGASFYHALTGEKPPHALERYATISKGKADTLTSLLQVRLDLPPCLAEILYNCMRVEAEKRYPNTSILLKKIAECKEQLRSTQIASSAYSASSKEDQDTSLSQISYEIGIARTPSSENQESSLLILLIAVLLGLVIGLVLAIWF